MKKNEGTGSNHATELFKLKFQNTLLTEQLGESTFSAEFHSIRWRQLKLISHYLSKLCSTVLDVNISSTKCVELINIADNQSQAGVLCTVAHNIGIEARALFETSSYIFLTSITDKRENKRNDDLFSKNKLPENILVEIGNLAQEFLRKNSKKTIANPIKFIGKLPDSEFLLSGRFIYPDASVNSDPEPFSVVGEIDTICKSRRTFTLRRKGEKCIKVNFDFFTQFLSICDVYLTSDRYLFHLMVEQDAFGKNSYYTLENIGEKTGGNLSFNF